MPRSEIPTPGRRAEQKIGVHGEVEIGSDAGVDAEEFRRRNSRYGDRDVVDQDRLTDGLDGPPKTFLAEVVAEDRNGLYCCTVVVGNDQASRCGGNAEGPKEVARDQVPLPTSA